MFVATVVLISVSAFPVTGSVVTDPPPTCPSHVASDFNGDGFADIAASEPNRTIGKVASAGAVRILYGGPAGLAITGTDQYFDQNSPGIVGAPTRNDLFGLQLATGNFNGDCFADLAIGTPGENDVTVLYGSAAGLTTIGAGHLVGDQASSSFGWDLAAGDFNGDGIDDLAVGAPGASDTGALKSGEVGIAYGSATGLPASLAWIEQSTASVPGVPEAGDGFGTSLAAGDFTGDGVTDLAVGVPYEDNGSIVDGGSVTVLLGSPIGGLTGTGAQLWTQNTPGVPGADETGDSFGLELAGGDVNGDAHADLVVGTPLEDIGSVTDAGDVSYLAGSAIGLSATGSVSFSQNSTGVPGIAEAGDEFGSSIAVGDVNGDGKGDIAVGTPSEDVGSIVDGGTVTVLPGSGTGPTAASSLSWDQDSPGIGGVVETSDEFGYAVYTANITSATHADLVVGVPFESTGAADFDGACNVILGSPTGLTAIGNQYFGEPIDVAPQQADDVWGAALA